MATSPPINSEFIGKIYMEIPQKDASVLFISVFLIALVNEMSSIGPPGEYREVESSLLSLINPM